MFVFMSLSVCKHNIFYISYLYIIQITHIHPKDGSTKSLSRSIAIFR